MDDDERLERGRLRSHVLTNPQELARVATRPSNLLVGAVRRLAHLALEELPRPAMDHLGNVLTSGVAAIAREAQAVTWGVGMQADWHVGRLACGQVGKETRCMGSGGRQLLANLVPVSTCRF